MFIYKQTEITKYVKYVKKSPTFQEKFKLH